MDRFPTLVELHFALWGVLAVPAGFAGLLFFFPGLMLVEGASFLAIAALLILYVTRLTRGARDAWLAGVVAHAGLALGAFLYVGRWPDLLAIPFLVANLYSLAVLLVHRAHWSGGRGPEARLA